MRCSRCDNTGAVAKWDSALGRIEWMPCICGVITSDRVLISNALKSQKPGISVDETGHDAGVYDAVALRWSSWIKSNVYLPSGAEVFLKLNVAAGSDIYVLRTEMVNPDWSPSNSDWIVNQKQFTRQMVMEAMSIQNIGFDRLAEPGVLPLVFIELGMLGADVRCPDWAPGFVPERRMTRPTVAIIRSVREQVQKKHGLGRESE